MMRGPFAFRMGMLALAVLSAISLVVAENIYDATSSGLVVLLAGGLLIGPLVSEFVGFKHSAKMLKLLVKTVQLFCAGGLLWIMTIASDRNPTDRAFDLGHIALILMLCRFFQIQRSRDYTQIFLLSMMVMVVAAITSGSIMLSPIYILYMFVSVYCLLHLQFLKQLEMVLPNHDNASADKPERNAIDEHEAKCFWSQLRGRRFKMTYGVIALSALFLSGVFFFIFPRVEADSLFGSRFGSKSVSGFTDQVILGSIDKNSSLRRVVGRVSIHQDGASTLPETNSYYLRCASLDLYRKSEYIKGRTLWGRSALNHYYTFINHFDIDPLQGTLRQEIQLKPIQSLFIPGIYPIVNIDIKGVDDKFIQISEIDRTVQQMSASKQQTRMYQAISLSRIDPELARRWFFRKLALLRHNWPRIGKDPQGISQPIFEIAWRIAGPWATRREELALKQREDFTRWMDHTTRRFPWPSRFRTRRMRTDVTEFDEMDDQGQEMVEQLYQTSLELAKIDRQIASLVRAYLQENYVYTLSVPAKSYSQESEEGRVDPIEAFLTTPDSKGNCEYFASAMIMMCRSLGIPSRMGVGYLLHEYLEPQDYYLVRQRDAHAWVEIYTADRDWEIFDPTPPSTASQTKAGFLSKAFHQIGTYFEKLQYRWSKYTGWFEFQPEATWAKEVSEWLMRFEAGEQPQPQGRVRSMFQIWFSHQQGEPYFYLFLRWMICFLFLVSLSIGVREFYIRLVPKCLRWRARRHRLKRAIQSPVEFYSKMLERLSQIHLYKPPSQTSREFARKVVLSRNELACVPELTELYYQVRFGQLPLDQQVEAQAAQTLEHLEKVIESIKHQPASSMAVGA